MRLLQRLFRFPPLSMGFISGLCFIMVLGMQSSGGLEDFELTAYDWLIRSRPKPRDGDESRILIVRINEQDILELGTWPLTDAVFSQALKNLLVHRPCAIGVDIFRDISIPPGSNDLSSILSGNPNIICVTKFGDEGVAPPPILEGTGQVGFNDMLVDPGGIIRRGLLFLDNGNEVFYAFSLLLAVHFLENRGIMAWPDETNPDCLKLGQTTIKPLESSDGGYVNADARGYQYLIDFKEPNPFYQSCSLTRLLAGQVSLRDIQGKIVLIGVSAQSVKDHFYTPFSRGLMADQQMPGVVLHARLVSQLIRFGLNESRPIRTWTEKQEISFMLLWSLLGSVACFFMRSPWRFSIIMAGGSFFLVFFSYAAFLNGWWIPLVPSVLAWISSAGITTAYMSGREKQQKTLLMQLFSRHVSREIADSVWAQRDQFLYRGRPKPLKMTVTVLFSDIKGFTAIAEALDPGALIEWLNTYMEAMTETIMKNGGVVDDYAGDGIKVNFGVPFPRKTRVEIGRDAANAVTCALAMGREMEKLNLMWKNRGLPQAGTRMGIYTGDIVAGAIGSSQRMKYTTVGDVVNIAARLESYDKALAVNYPWRILIGETTWVYLDEKFNVEVIGKAGLKGKNEKIIIYRVLSKKEDTPNPMTMEEQV